MPTARPPVALSTRRRISKVLMSRLVRLTSRCVAKPASTPRIEDGARPLGPGGQAHRQLVAEADAVDVGLLDVGAHPEIVRVDQRHDRLARAHDLAGPRGAHVHDAVDRGVDLRVAEPHVGLVASARSRRPAGAGWSSQLAARFIAICSAFARASATVARCASTCLPERLDLRALRRVEAGARLVELLGGDPLLLDELLRALEAQPRALEIGLGRRALRLGRRPASPRPDGSGRASAAPEAQRRLALLAPAR